MTEHATTGAAPNAADLFEIIRTIWSMRRLKPEPAPNQLIPKILEAGVCAPSGGNMQRWRFLMIPDSKVKQTVAAFYKRAWDEQVAPLYRSGEPAPGMSPARFSKSPRRGGVSGEAHPRGSRMDRALPRRRDTDPHVRLVHLSSMKIGGGSPPAIYSDPEAPGLSLLLAQSLPAVVVIIGDSCHIP
jgi:nitroreductase